MENSLSRPQGGNICEVCRKRANCSHESLIKVGNIVKCSEFQE